MISLPGEAGIGALAGRPKVILEMMVTVALSLTLGKRSQAKQLPTLFHVRGVDYCLSCFLRQRT